jgi:hypothetical protein
MRRILPFAIQQSVTIVLTLVAIEIFLHVADFRYLRLGRNELTLPYAYDAELGWFPVPNTTSLFAGQASNTARTIHVQNNSLGLRDIEPERGPKPTILVLGDSYVWGYDVEADERLTEFLRRRLPDHRIVNAGVSGYGTDQEYLLLRRLWDRRRPEVVILVTFYNDHQDNSGNYGYWAYKPYFQVSPAGGEFRGQPVPRSRYLRFRDNWWAENLFFVRLAISVYVEFSHRKVNIPDPTEHLIRMMRDFVEARGAKFVIGELDGKTMVNFFSAERIPYVSLEGAPDRPDLHYHAADGLGHWNPAGQAEAGAKILGLLVENGIVRSGANDR